MRSRRTKVRHESPLERAKRLTRNAEREEREAQEKAARSAARSAAWAEAHPVEAARRRAKSDATRTRREAEETEEAAWLRMVCEAHRDDYAFDCAEAERRGETISQLRERRDAEAKAEREAARQAEREAIEAALQAALEAQLRAAGQRGAGWIYLTNRPPKPTRADKLRAMTVANGCTPAEAATAAEILGRMRA
jgi:hypothetical protein